MNPDAIFWPMIGHVILVYIVYWRMSSARIGAIKRGEAKVSQFRENRNEPEASLFIRNNLTNQFELPILFYPACLALHVAGGVNWISVALAWAFVASRYVHAWIHTTSNRIRYRRPAFLAGFFLLFALWVCLAIVLITKP
jgi:hypothetical protein